MARTLEITINDGTDAIEGATVTISNKTETTDENGKAAFTLNDGTYTASVTASGYADKSSSITINGADATATISLEVVDTLTVTVDDGVIAIEGATVTIDGVTKTASNLGVATFTDMTYKDYTAEVSATGFTTKSETLQFRSNHKSFTVSLAGSSTGVLSFTLEDHQNNRVEGATVKIKASQDGEALDTVTTDSNGEGEFDPMPYGTYYVDAITSDETLHNENMIQTIHTAETTANFVVHP